MKNTHVRWLKNALCVFLFLCGGVASRVGGSELFSISGIAPQANGEMKLSVVGVSTNPVIIQGSTDFSTWANLRTNSLNGGTIVFTDAQNNGFVKRYYRLKSSPGGAIPPVTLPDLASYPNRVFPAQEGFDTVQYAPNGNLGFIVWRDQELIFRERNARGDWVEKVVDTDGNIFKMLLVFDFSGLREDYKFQPAATLLYDSGSRPHVFRTRGRNIAHYLGNSNGSWSEVETIKNPQANGNGGTLVAAIGVNNIFHLGVLSAGSPRNLTYGTNKNGQWNWTTISSVTDAPLTYWAPPFAARWLSMAVDSRNNAHFAFRSSMDMTYDTGGHPRAYSELKYASNSEGQWKISLVMKPDNSSAEAANGASIAIGTDDKPHIVSWYDERAETGSAQESAMYFHNRDQAGNWSSTVVLDQPDGYSAGDGPKGTGFSPYLRYDSQGRAHILFMDHAGQHFGGIGQQEYAGNTRHGWWNGTGWSFETVFRQAAPVDQESVYPAFAMGQNELAITLLGRETRWNLTSYPPLSNSTYMFRVLIKAMR